MEGRIQRLVCLLLFSFLALNVSVLGASKKPPPSPPFSPPPPPYQYTEYEYIVKGLDIITLFNTTIKYLKRTCLDVALGFTNQTTFLAPTNQAWRNLKYIPNGKALRKKLWSSNKETVLFNLLLFHIIPQYKTSSDFQSTTDKTVLPTYLGAPLYFSPFNALNYFYSNFTYSSNNVTALYADVLADSVVSIQGIDGVLIPADLDALDTPRPGLVPCPTQISPPPPPPSPPPAPSPPPPPYQYTEYEYIVQGLDVLTLMNTTIKYLNETCLDVALSFTNQTTFLAPVNDAWGALKTHSQGKKLLKLLAGEDRLTVIFNLLLFHMLPQYRTSSDFQSTTDKTVLPTYLGAPLYFSPFNALNYFYANFTNPLINATGLYADVLADSVISIQGLDSVLIPADLDALLVPRPGYVPCPAYVVKTSSPPPPSVSPDERKTLEIAKLISVNSVPAPSSSSYSWVLVLSLAGVALLILTTIFRADVVLVK